MADITKNKKDTVAILYPGGGYGTFIEWSIMFLTGKIPVSERPFTASGSSHRYSGHGYDLINSSPSSTYFESADEFRLIRTHGNVGPNFSFQKFVNLYGPYLNHIVLMQPTPDTTLMLIHNLLTKVSGPHNLRKQIDQICIGDDPAWVKRENLSFWLESRHLPYIGWSTATGPNVTPVLIKQFIYDPKATLLSIMEEIGFVAHEDRINLFDSIIQEWRSLQKFLDIDDVALKIITSTINDEYFDWSSIGLSMIDEAFIQMQLRNLHKLDLLCYNLNRFPTNSKDLRKLLTNV